MELPITIVFEPPSRTELRALLRRRWLWSAAVALLAVSVGILVAVASASRAEALATSAAPTVAIRSRPAGAEISVDGRSVGHTPAALTIAAGRHALELKAGDVASALYSLDVGADDSSFEALLWRRQPLVSRLRSPVPGATLSDAHLTPDGNVSLGVSLTPDQELQAWRFDPVSGVPELLVAGAIGARPNLAPDGSHVAYAGRKVGPVWPGSVIRNQVVWLAASGAPAAAPVALWHAPSGEAVLDVSWAPDSRRLLASTAQELTAGGVRTRLWLVDPLSGVVRLLLNLPSQIVPGAFVWNPDGQRVALLAHAGALTALCVLELDGELRYLADLEPVEGTPLVYPPLTWSVDGQRALFAAPNPHALAAPATWFQPAARWGIYVMDRTAQAPRLLAEADTLLATEREDGQLVALTRTRDGTLAIDLPGSSASAQRLVDVPLKIGALVAAEWDLAQGRVLIAKRVAGDVEFWLVRLGLEDRP